MRRWAAVKRLAPVALAVVVAAAVVAGYWYARAPRATRVRVGQTAPELALAFVDGGTPARLSRYRSSPVLLVFFDTRAEEAFTYVLELERLHQMHLRRGLVVIGVDVRDDAEARSLESARNLGLTFLVLRDPGGRGREPAWGRAAPPEAYLIAPGGQVRAVWVGRLNWRLPQVREAIDAVLGPPSPLPAS